METESKLADQVSLDANGELLINGRRASTEQLEAMLAQKAPTTPTTSTTPTTPASPTTRGSVLVDVAEGAGSPPIGASRSRGVEPFAQAGILSLFVVVLAAALNIAFAAYTKARLIRAYAGLKTTFETVDGVRPPARSTTHPMIAAIFPFLVVAIVAGGAIAGLRWWHRRNGSIGAVGVSFVLALGGVFVFASDLWTWTSYLEHNPLGSIISEALKRNTTWASLLGLGGSVVALAFLAMGIKTALDRRA